MNKKMRRLVGKGMIVMGSAALLLSPVYAGNVVISSAEAEVSQEEVQNSEVSSETEEYEIASDEEVRISIYAHINLNGNKLMGISNEGKALVEDEDYWIIDYQKDNVTVEINTYYMNRQEVGDLNLTFEFNQGEAQQLTIKILPMQTEAKLSRLSDVYDRSEDKNWTGTVIKFNHNTFLGAYIGGRELDYEKDYDVTRTTDTMGVWFTDEFLRTLPIGENEVVFKFDKTNPIIFTINVIDKKGTLQLQVDKSTALESNTIGNSFKLTAAGEDTYDLSKLKIHYYYTADGEAAQSAAVDNAAINYTQAPWYQGITNNVQAEIIKMETPAATADTYLELGFTGNAVLNNTATMTIDTRINKSDWSNYDQSNDYSYANAANICIYYNDQLISGIEPK